MQTEPLPSPKALKQRWQAPQYLLDFVKESRHALKNILEGKDSRLALIIGPCSIHDIAATKDYAQRLKKLAGEVDDKFLVIMRTYFEKPRTTVGWKGLVYDPHIDGSHNLAAGLDMLESSSYSSQSLACR